MAPVAAPQPGRRTVLAAGLAALLLAVSAPLAWNALQGESRTSGSPAKQAVAATATGTSNAAARSLEVATPLHAGARGVTARDQPAPAALLQTPALASVIEDLIGDALGNGNWRDDPQGFRARLDERVRTHFQPTLANDAMAFVLRYLGYLESLEAMHLRPPANDVAALRATFDARRSLRMALFSAEEYAALFAADDRLDRYTMARFEIDADALRPPAERAAAVAVAERELTAGEREDRSRWLEHLNLQSQTAAFDAQGASEQARYAVRLAAHGEAVAQRLSELDRVDLEWATRLTQYELALNAQRSGTLASEDLAAARNRLFSEREQLRLDAALSLRRRQSGS